MILLFEVSSSRLWEGPAIIGIKLLKIQKYSPSIELSSLFAVAIVWPSKVYIG